MVSPTISAKLKSRPIISVSPGLGMKSTYSRPKSPAAGRSSKNTASCPPKPERWFNRLVKHNTKEEVSDSMSGNIDLPTVDGFGAEWDAYDQSALEPAELGRMWRDYFGIFPFDRLPPGSEGFDMGCGSGRWAKIVAPRVGLLHCIDPAEVALKVARRNLATEPNCQFHLAGVDELPMPDASQDFGYSLGVLHHIPETERGLRACTAKLKPGAPFLLYLYYNFDNRPAWFRALWSVSDAGRKAICRLPFGLRRRLTAGIAVMIYWPLTRAARLLERAGKDVAAFPLSAYRKSSLYTLKTDALDRFGTRLEHRFSRAEMSAMMERSGLSEIRFHEGTPHWVGVGIKAP